MKTWILSFLILLMAQSAVAATYWVSKSATSQQCVDSVADPGAGSSSLTINQALGCLSNTQGAGAGSTIVVKVGTYVEGILRNSSNPPPSGTSWSAPFTIRANTGDLVTLRNSSGMNVNVSATFSDLYFIIQGFTFDGVNLDSGTAQVFLGDGAPSAPNHVKVIDSFFINNTSVSAILTAGSDTQFINNKVHGGFAGTGTSNLGYHIPVYVQGSNSLISGNEVYDYPGWGMQLYNGLGSSNDNNIVSNNWFHNGGWGSVTSGNIPARVAILSYGGDNTRIYNNIVSDGTGKCYGLGPGAAPAVYNNTCYNMTADSSGDNIGGADTGPSTAVIKNNIFTNLHGQAVFSATPNSNTNNNFCDGLSTGCTVTGAIGFVNASSGDFHLQAGSPAIDAGTPNIIPGIVIPACSGGVTILCYNGTAPDIGALESGVPSVGGTPPTVRPNPPVGITIGMVISATAENDAGTRRTANTGDYVGLYVPGASANTFIDWFYMNGTKTAPSVAINDALILFTAPSAVGVYEFRFYQNNSTSETDRLATAAFTVGPKGLVFKYNGSSVTKMAGTSQTVKVGVP